ncbi:hypothetical protein Cantr_01785 [Candida viswanathii]|uniref:Uncharacterized protein n=1 Tax=Candida viswanathii TaxID=5486 RepID=A0A367YLV1_9ASCO|nr:hypothetical protein Cantr_01785 [Candida viswanathii]
MATHEMNYTNDRRQTPRNRFGWVRRLMQGQNRATIHPAPPTSSTTPGTASTGRAGTSHRARHDAANTRNTRLANARNTRNSEDARSQQNDELDSLHNDDEHSLDVTSDMHSDNVSTTPLKSIISTQSTKEPSILSGEANNDLTSLNASTAETSLAPSVNTPTNYTFAPTTTNNTTGSATATPTSNSSNTNNTNNNQTLNLNSSGAPDRDSESIVTLASSTRRIRRRSIDTNCSTAGIPPASIMERLSVQPANSNYANSIRTANDRASQVEAASHYDDQGSSVRSFN